MPIELRMVGLTEFKEYINLMLLSYVEEINKTFLKTHSYSGFMLSLDRENLAAYCSRYLLHRSYDDEEDVESENFSFLVFEQGKELSEISNRIFRDIMDLTDEEYAV